MKYLLLNTDIDCFACLDNALLELLSFAVDSELFYVGEDHKYKILIKTDQPETDILNVIKSNPVIVSEKIDINEIKLEDFLEIQKGFKKYSKSFFGE